MNLLNSNVWRIGTVHLKALGTREISGNPAGSKGSVIMGEAHVYQATIRSGVNLEIGDVTWETGDREVQCLSCSRSTPEKLRRLRRGLRLVVKHVDKDTIRVDLRQARIDFDQGEDWSKLYQATMEELTEGAGISVRKLLEGFGAEVDRREQLLGDTGPHRFRLCAIFPTESNHLPVVCYVLTRILPLTRSMMVL
ncbi:hypothetical protein ACFL5F_05180 [Planctomycetota bacterium]